MTFDEAYDLTLTWEGGGKLHKVAGDPGGTTRFGLSQRAYPNLDMHRLTLPQASLYARRDYWNVVKADEVPEELRWHLFDMAFNAGVGTSVRLLQKSINLCRQSAGRTDFLAEDGVIGPRTLEGTDEIRPERLTRVFKAYRIEHYLVLAETSLPKFIHGWLRRAEGERNG
jgi:lysozyme family protein